MATRPASGRLVALAVLMLAWPAMGQLDEAAKRAADLQRARVQKVVRKFVAETGHSVTGCGSWISGAYNAATSDHDMRLLLPKSAANPGAQWQQAKSALGRMIREEFGAEAGPILERTNLYAPSQLMGTVLDADDALAVYTKVGEVPNLGFSGKVGPTTPAKYVEGLYGEGSGAFTQFYEQTKGRCFYRAENGKAVVGAVDLTHFLDGQRTFTSAGTANTAIQWGEHCLDELRAGRSDKVLKYLKRLGNDLTKSRELARLGTATLNKAEIAALVTALEGGTPLGQVATRVRQLVASSHMEASTLKAFATAGPVGRLMQRELLVGLENPKGPVGRLLGQIWAQAPNAAQFERIMTAVMVLQAANTTALAAAQGDMGETLMVAGIQSLLLKSLPLGLLAELTKAIIDQARAGGIDLVVNRQDAWDLMAGIYTGLGRERDEPDTRFCFTLERLVAECLSEARLRQVVWTQCQRATNRDIAGAPARDDAAAGDAMLARCYPVILQAWRWQRDQLAAEYLVLAQDVMHAPLALSYQPCPAVWAGQPVEVTVTPGCQDRRFYAKLSRMRRLLTLLSGAGSFIDESYAWSPVTRSSLEGPRTFRFSKPGTYTVSVTMTLKPGSGPNPLPDPPAMLAVGTVRSSVEVEVTDPNTAKPEPPNPPAATGRWVLVRTSRRDTGQVGAPVVKLGTGLGSVRTELDLTLWPQFKVPHPLTAAGAWEAAPTTIAPGQDITLRCSGNSFVRAGAWLYTPPDGTVVSKALLVHPADYYMGAQTIAAGPAVAADLKTQVPADRAGRALALRLTIEDFCGYTGTELNHEYVWVAAGQSSPAYEGVKVRE